MWHTLIKHDLKALQAFVAIVECQGVSAAQERLHMSQSAISNHLSHLEESLGVSLCKRGRSGFALTKAGHQLYEACTQLLQATNEFHREVQNIKWHRSILSGTLRLGFISHLPTPLQNSISQIIAKAAQEHPQLRLSIDVCAPEMLESAIASNHMDVGIGYFPHFLNNLSYLPIFESSDQLYCHVNHPAAQAKDLVLADLTAQYAWVKQSDHPLPEYASSHVGVTTGTAHQPEATLLFILAGSHIGFLSTTLAEPYVKKGMLTALLSHQISYHLSYFTATRATPDPRVNWFLDELNDLMP